MSLFSTSEERGSLAGGTSLAVGGSRDGGGSLAAGSMSVFEAVVPVVIGLCGALVD